ncbi:MAG: mycofactocin system FadH/OYE family oxidoreductase 1 [Rhodococcus sp.]|nr:mycofactocin system FadH/OYE family oxidoreductase 1 [Rhodococcus sp. (in: high G+C Gram-positive bacteria)]
MSPRLTEQFTLAGCTAQSRVLFGPHETNLGSGRALSDRHVAYYRRRAQGGAGIIVVENASVHASDHPYERAPLADECVPGWRRIAKACRPHGTVVLAGLTHHGLQGSSAHTRTALWAPSRVADVETREMPMVMEQREIDEVVAGFASSAAAAVRAGLDGVEIDAGPRSLLRQFHSGLTNLRSDDYGADRLRLTNDVLSAVRGVLGRDQVLALRLSCDELAPWAGVTPEIAARQARELAAALDLLVVVRGGTLSASAYRPDFHEPSGFNTQLCAGVREAVSGNTTVALQGSMTDPAAAQQALDRGVADIVEMTRAQIADPDLVESVRRGRAHRPCVLCNQTCLVRDSRNPIVTCAVHPDAGHECETDEDCGADIERAGADTRRVVVVGGGPAGLEAARVLARGGYDVTIAERTAHVGGMIGVAATATPSLRAITDHLESECRRLGVRLCTGTDMTSDEIDGLVGDGVAVIVATGSRPRPPDFPVGGPYVDAAELLTNWVSLSAGSGPIVVFDPVGGPVGIAVAEWLHARDREVSIVTPDSVVGRDLSRTGDLVGANVRAQRKGIVRHLGMRITALRGRELHVADRFTGEQRIVPCELLVDCSHRLPDRATDRPSLAHVGDCVAPRTVLEAIREGRRSARALTALPHHIHASRTTLTSQEN